MKEAGVSPDIRTYNDLITICHRCGKLDKAAQLYATMKSEGLRLDARTFTTVAGVFSKLSDWQSALALIDEAEASNIKPGYILYTNVISACAKKGEWGHALGLISKMKASSVAPNRITYNAAIHACCKAGQREIGAKLVEEMKDQSLGVDVVTYTSLIAGHMWAKDIKSVIGTFKQMQADKVKPNGQTYASVLTALTTAGLWKSALDAYSNVLEQRVSVPTSIHNMAISSHLRLGEWLQAVKAYMRMRNERISQDIHSHCLAVQAHFFGGQHESGMRFVNQIVEMQASDTNAASSQAASEPRLKLFTAALKGCEKNGLWREAIQLVNESELRYNISSEQIFNSAIGACTRARRMTEAFKLYSRMKQRGGLRPSPATFAPLLAATAQAQVVKTKTTTNNNNNYSSSTPPSDLASSSAWELALQVEAEMNVAAIPLDIVTFTALITALGKAGKWQRAVAAYDRMVANHVEPNEITHSALITGFGNGLQWQRALDAFEKCEESAKSRGAQVGEMPYSCLASAMGKSRQWERVLQVLHSYERTQDPLGVVMYNSVLWALARCGRVDEAERLLGEMLPHLHDDKLLHSFITPATNLRSSAPPSASSSASPPAPKSAPSEELDGIEAEEDESGASPQISSGAKLIPAPNVASWGGVIEACARANDWPRALRLFQEMVVLQPSTKATLPMAVRLLNLMLGNKQWGEAISVFDALLKQGVPMDRYKYTAAITACVRSKDSYLVNVKAHNLFRDMRNKNIVPGVVEYGAIIHACAKEKNLQRAMLLFDQMHDEGVEPDVAIYTSLIKACAHSNEWERALNLFSDLEQMCEIDPQKEPPNLLTYNALITTLINCRQRHKAMLVFEDMVDNQAALTPDRVTYDRLIQGFEVKGEWETILSLMQQMQNDDHNAGVAPTAVTYHRAISACQQRGAWERALDFYNEMVDRDLKLRENTYLALYDACYEANKPDIAAQFYTFLQQSTEDKPLAAKFKDDRFFDDEEEDDDAYNAYDPEPLESEPSLIDVYDQ